jgi:KDO2-lipid IV(A) lauroyltransferase
VSTLLILFARGFIALIQTLPLVFVARLGRAGGALAYWLDARHRKVALANLELVFGSEKSGDERRAIARENFRRLGENYLCSLKTVVMPREALAKRMEWVGIREAIPVDGRSMVAAIGHFGQFELFGRVTEQAPDWAAAVTYRALRQPALNKLLLDLRKRSGALFFERRTEADQLKKAMNHGRMLLALLADQHGGDRGLWLPFLGHDCSCNAGSAVLALRYEARLRSAICYRVGLARWRLEVGPEIPTRDATGNPRSSEAITRDLNAALEVAVRRDPANWFWVHRRWKPASKWQMAVAAGAPTQSEG